MPSRSKIVVNIENHINFNKIRAIHGIILNKKDMIMV